MKTLYLNLITILVTLNAFGSIAQSIPAPVVDQRVELLSIVFRLAGNPEYTTADNVNYVKAIHQHFDRYAGHPLIRYAKALHDGSAISYDAVMSMAVHLKSPPALTPIISFNAEVPDIRWKAEDAIKFVSLLQQFYKDADCATFFRAQAGRYSVAQKRFNVLFQKLDAGWYPKFYGKSSGESFNIIIGLGNGGGNYGPHLSLPRKPKLVYAIMGSATFDNTGAPTYDSDSYLPTLIHEFNHSFINRLTDLYSEQLKASGEVIFKKESAKMHSLAYGTWNTMYSEALVRAAVVLYLKEHTADTLVADREIKKQQALGFVWMPQLVNLLQDYEKHKRTYPTLERFMSQIVAFYDQTALNIDGYEEEYLQHCAKVVSISPFKNGDVNVYATTSEIRFNFNKPLDGIRYFLGPGKKGAEHYPKPIKFSCENDNKTLVMKIELQPNTEYQINVAGSRMRTSDGYSVQNYVLDFKTGSK